MQQLTEHFKFSFRHDGVRPSFSLRPILRWPRPEGFDQRRVEAVGENIVLIRFYRKKFTLASLPPLPNPPCQGVGHRGNFGLD